MKMKHDPTADAIYIYLSDEPYAYGRDLDNDRRVDYSSDGSPIGVELLRVSKGINVDDLPDQEKIAELLEDGHFKVFA